MHYGIGHMGPPEVNMEVDPLEVNTKLDPPEVSTEVDPLPPEVNMEVDPPPGSEHRSGPHRSGCRRGGGRGPAEKYKRAVCLRKKASLCYSHSLL